MRKLRNGTCFPDAKDLLTPLPPRTASNHELWEVLNIDYLTIFEVYRHKPEKTQIPVNWLAFRHRRDFVAGSWNVFKSNWLPHIQLMVSQEKSNFRLLMI